MKKLPPGYGANAGYSGDRKNASAERYGSNDVKGLFPMRGVNVHEYAQPDEYEIYERGNDYTDMYNANCKRNSDKIGRNLKDSGQYMGP